MTSVDDTTEIRWFSDGPLPAEVVAWFSGGGLPGLVEHRTDSYRLDSCCEIGVKRRFGQTLELKTRLAGPALLVLDSDLAGRVETWRRWSPADGRVGLCTNQAWVDVHKTIVKRRFDANGNETPLSEAARAMIGVACDVEIATIELDSRLAWSLAFAAFGPVTCRQNSILAAWGALRPGRPLVVGSRLGSGNSCGYPEWLIKATTPRRCGSQIEATGTREQSSAAPQPVAD